MALTKINSSVIANNTIAVGNIADNSVDATKIASNSILTRHIDDDQITGDQLADALTVVTSVTVPTITVGDGHTMGDDGDDNFVLTGSAGENVIIDSAVNIILDADIGEVQFKDAGTEIGVVSMANSNMNIESKVSDKDILFKGIDDTSDVTALTLDMSEAGAATFNSTVNGLTLAAGSVATSTSQNFALNTPNSLRINIDSNNSATDQVFVVGHNRTDVGTTSSLLVIQEDGNVGIGTANPGYELHVEDDATETTIAVRSSIGGTGSAVGGRLRLQLGAQSNSGSGNADSQSGDTLGEVLFEGQGTDYSYQGGTIKTIVTTGDGTATRSEQGTAMTFGTTSVGSVSPAERMRIASDGKVSITAVGAMAMDVQGEGGSHGLAIGGNDGGFGYIGHRSSGAYDLKINSSGYVNMASQPCFSAALPAATSTDNVIIFGGEHLDVGGHYNTSNGRFTAPIAGNYHFTFWILMDPGGANHYSRVLFRVNGSSSTQWTDNLENASREAQGDFHSVGGAAIIPLGANDYVDLYNSGQNPTYGTAYGNFSGFLVS